MAHSKSVEEFIFIICSLPYLHLCFTKLSIMMSFGPYFTDARAQSKVTRGDGKTSPGATVPTVITVTTVITTYWKLGEGRGYFTD